ncbi:mucin-1-like [Setaria italica]|uniref:mucin-1-like n=1 Tax=Setaria italica TaxID=4555 RepID=UPI00035136D0|nr:mucin-1-like [Setaria italica]
MSPLLSSSVRGGAPPTPRRGGSGASFPLSTGTPSPTSTSRTVQAPSEESSPQAPTPKAAAHLSLEGTPPPAPTHLSSVTNTPPVNASPSSTHSSTPTALPIPIPLPVPKVEGRSPPLSPTARPFFPGESSVGHPKVVRWQDFSDDEECIDYELLASASPSPRTASYRDVLYRPAPSSLVVATNPSAGPPAG